MTLSSHDHGPVGEIVREFALRLINLNVELNGESGPYREASSDLVRLASELWTDTNKKLQPHQANASPHAAQLVAALAPILDQLLADVAEGLRGAFSAADEEKACQIIGVCAGHATGLLARLRTACATCKPPLALPGSPRKNFEGAQTVLMLDLARYTEKAQAIARTLGKGTSREAEGLSLLRERIQDQLADALARCGFPASFDPVLQTAGDGAVLLFPIPDEAVRFAQALIAVAAEENEGGADNLADFHYRVGISAGFLRVTGRQAAPFPRLDTAGFPFIDAARLLAKAYTGEILVSETCWEQVQSDDLKRSFSAPGTIPGKRAEVYHARCQQVVESATWDQAPNPDRATLPRATVPKN